MGHDHDHGTDSAAVSNKRRLALVLAITGIVLVAEVVGSVLTGSLALLADAGHIAAVEERDDVHQRQERNESSEAPLDRQLAQIVTTLNVRRRGGVKISASL
jgi:hypothetical protein